MIDLGLTDDRGAPGVRLVWFSPPHSVFRNVIEVPKAMIANPGRDIACSLHPAVIEADECLITCACARLLPLCIVETPPVPVPCPLCSKK